FPVSAWLPASYHTLPTPIAALFAALLTKVGVYAVLRLLGDVFAGSFPLLIEALGWIAAATMLFGVLGAAWHWDIRHILLGIALATTESQAGAIFYSIHHSLVKGNLFLVAAIICRISGSYDLRRCGGLATARPWLAGIFALSALSLVGIPPLSGFWAKLAIVRAALVEERYLWAVFALGVGFLTLYSMLKIWLEAFWKAHPDPGWAPPADTRLMPAYLVTAALAGVTVVIGLAPGPLLLYGRAATAALGRALP
ncbi:MAG: Na+/H+ antiporter subunit D, partial [Gammaproteobacteria bacterium]|nr:Na+/H+ antiporter subunit D [Gammaproteobacteria bacterium]